MSIYVLCPFAAEAIEYAVPPLGLIRLCCMNHIRNSQLVALHGSLHLVRCGR